MTKKITAKKTFILEQQFTKDDVLISHIVHIKEDLLLDFLKECVDCETLYEKAPYVDIEDLSANLLNIERNVVNEHHNTKKACSELVKYLRSLEKNKAEKVKNLLAQNKISFDCLSLYYRKDSFVTFTDGDQLTCGQVQKCDYMTNWFGSYLQITVKKIKSDGKNMTFYVKNIEVAKFNGIIELDKLEIKLISKEHDKLLTERGKKYCNFASGSKTFDYTGQMLIRSWMKDFYVNAEGRVQVDAYNYMIHTNNSTKYDPPSATTTTIKTIDPQFYKITDAYVYGFSFQLKAWGEFAISQLNEVVYNTKAFDILVLDEEKKKLIKALASNASHGFKDIIKDKSGGCIFLLHGPPGTGKTLTAESISEKMQRPLYVISVGELGVTPDELENKLKKILDLASLWNAYILIDEADIFLEKRSTNDLVRNAMVGIFLRLLEYYQGVMFLTTNRINEFDEAFFSRISVILNYEKHTADGLQKIWTNLLKFAEVENIDVSKLKDYDVNGRQIKNCIRLVQAVNKDENRTITTQDIVKMLDSQFCKSHLKKGFANA